MSLFARAAVGADSQFAQPFAGLQRFRRARVTLNYVAELLHTAILLAEFNQRETFFQLRGSGFAYGREVLKNLIVALGSLLIVSLAELNLSQIEIAVTSQIGVWVELDVVKFYPNTNLAGNCYFYLGEIQFRQGNYQQAAQSYDQVLQNFPTGTKVASAQLKKGFSLIELGKQDDGVQELRHVIQRYPRSPEALQARERLRKLGVSSTGRPGE